jgi:diguanylate cyclase (GGDEF)-like protein
MRHPFLIVNHHLNNDNLSLEFSKTFEITVVRDGKEGLAALSSQTPWCGVLAASELPDMNGLDFLEQAGALSNALPLLLAPDAELPGILRAANNRSIFRVIPASTSEADLFPIFLDAAHQHTLVQHEQRLQAEIALLSRIDPLTGCANRLHLDELLNKELNRSLRYSHYLSIILCDIDGLKGINEAFGHRAGDAVLTDFVRITTQLIRQDIDTITRWGDDEFLVVLPETPLRGAGRVASRLCEQFAGLDCTVDGNAIRCTASFGVAGFAPETADRNAAVDDLLLIAERCLAQAKATGGNQVLCCP